MEKIADKTSKVVVRKNGEEFVVTVQELIDCYEKHNSVSAYAKVSSEPTTIEVESFKDIPDEFTGVCKTSIAIFHLKNGRFHNENGSAIKYLNGNEKWYFHGYLHNENGPAVKHHQYQEWHYHGKEYGINDDFNSVTWASKVKELKSFYSMIRER